MTGKNGVLIASIEKENLIRGTLSRDNLGPWSIDYQRLSNVPSRK